MAGAIIFGDSGGWLLMLRALYWTFHLWRGSIMRFLFHGRRNIWQSWSVIFVAGEAFREILGDSRSAKCCIILYKNASQVSRAAGARWRFYRRIMVGLSSNRLYIGGSNSWIFRWSLELRIWWQPQYLVMLEGAQTPVAPRIVLDVSFETRINHGSHFSWQAQYLVKLKITPVMLKALYWTFIYDEDQPSESFSVAGPILRDVGRWLLLLRALYRTFHVRQGSIIRAIFRGRPNIWWCWRVTLVAPRIVMDVSCETRINHQSHLAWQTQYLVMLEGDSCCSAHCNGRFMWDKDRSSESFTLSIRYWLESMEIDDFWIDFQILITINRKLWFCSWFWFWFYWFFWFSYWFCFWFYVWFLHWIFGSQGYKLKRIKINFVPQAWKSLCWEAWKSTAFGFGKSHELW